MCACECVLTREILSVSEPRFSAKSKFVYLCAYGCVCVCACVLVDKKISNQNICVCLCLCMHGRESEERKVSKFSLW